MEGARSVCGETGSVRGHVVWETSVLLGHTADSHGPYSPASTFWNGLLVSAGFFFFFPLSFFLLPRCSGPINQSQLVPSSFCHWLVSAWLQSFAQFCSDILRTSPSSVSAAIKTGGKKNVSRKIMSACQTYHRNIFIPMK